jgi:ribosomal-protein-alanine N-acetyltransferase
MMDTPSLAVMIRRMEMRDISRVMEIDRQSFSLTWPEKSYIFELTRNGNSRIWLAEIADPEPFLKVIGVLGVWVILDEAHISTVAVDPDYRQLHVASQLLEFALRMAGSEGASVTRLEVRAGNSAAIRMYEKFGFLTVSIRPRYYADNGEDALLMDLDMAAAGYTRIGELPS